MGIHTFMHTQFEIPNVDPEKKIAFWWQIWLTHVLATNQVKWGY